MNEDEVVDPIHRNSHPHHVGDHRARPAATHPAYERRLPDCMWRSASERGARLLAESFDRGVDHSLVDSHARRIVVEPSISGLTKSAVKLVDVVLVDDRLVEPAELAAMRAGSCGRRLVEIPGEQKTQGGRADRNSMSRVRCLCRPLRTAVSCASAARLLWNTGARKCSK
jgi:hypothetical protein